MDTCHVDTSPTSINLEISWWTPTLTTLIFPSPLKSPSTAITLVRSFGLSIFIFTDRFLASNRGGRGGSRSRGRGGRGGHHGADFTTLEALYAEQSRNLMSTSAAGSLTSLSVNAPSYLRVDISDEKLYHGRIDILTALKKLPETATEIVNYRVDSAALGPVHLHPCVSVSSSYTKKKTFISILAGHYC